MTNLLVVLGVGFGTYLTRASFIVALADRELPPAALRALSQVGPAVLAALVASILVGDDGVGQLLPSPETLALVAAGAVAWRTHSVVACLAVGMSTLWVLSWVWA